MQQLIQLVRRARLQARLKDDFWADAYFQHSCWPERSRVDPQTEHLVFEDSGLILDKTQAALVPSQAFAKDLVSQGAKFGRNEDGKTTVSIDDLAFLVQIRQDISFLHDVFFDGSYQIGLPPSEKKRIV